MREIRVLALAAAAVLGVGVLAVPAPALQMSGTAYVTASRPLYAQLLTKLDTKNAKVGEAVTARIVTESVLGNNVTVPRGSLLTGKVTDVQSKSASGNGMASITVVFDQIQPGKKGTSIAIDGVVVGVALQPYLSDSGPNASSLPLAPSHSAASQAAEAGGSYDTSHSNETVDTGSSIRGVNLVSTPNKDAGKMQSSKDFKLNKGARMAVELESQ